METKVRMGISLTPRQMKFFYQMDSRCQRTSLTNCKLLFIFRYAHQKTGVSWLHKLYLEKKGGILADDMGLGKTA